MYRVEKNCKITIAYTMSDKFGNLIEEVPKENPLVYLHGHQNIIPGLERRLEGHQKGELLKFSIGPDEAYGPYMDDMIVEVEPEELEGLGKLEPGMEIELFREELLDDDDDDENEDESPLVEEGPSFGLPQDVDDLYDDPDEELDAEEDEEPMVFIIKEVHKDRIVLDGNHRLAGKDLFFQIKVLEIEEATFEEIERGYLDYYNSEDDQDGTPNGDRPPYYN